VIFGLRTRSHTVRKSEEVGANGRKPDPRHEGRYDNDCNGDFSSSTHGFCMSFCFITICRYDRMAEEWGFSDTTGCSEKSVPTGSQMPQLRQSAPDPEITAR
jgi:hypothetical protein